jgi:hypothetical protein
MPWPYGVAAHVRQEACAALRHVAVTDDGLCPLTDDDLMSALIELVGQLRDELAAHDMEVR